MIDISTIKLIVWDLDETFWHGILSEGEIEPIEQNIRLVRDLTDAGIIHAICSKNDPEPVMERLRQQGVADYFVFNSIDWTPKGPRIERMLREMGLRAVNVLFLDDNTTNLNEAKHYSPDLQIAEPDVIPSLIDQCAQLPKSDTAHKRLKQYQILEVKQKAKAGANDNRSFLFSSNTQVEMHEDCLPELDRLTELVNRTNQLNFTKVRSTKEELTALLQDPSVKAGYVTVRDKFGDYGIVGFYAIRDNKLIHFLFSCRTIGQGVEQYVYSMLGWPELTVVGNVINQVARVPAPEWINQEQKTVEKQSQVINRKILLKGACDMSIMSGFMNSKQIVSEFTFLGQLRQNEVEHHNHSINYLRMPFLSAEEQKQLVDECIFCDPEMFRSQMYDPDVDMLFLSSMIEPNLGIYRNKRTGYEIAFAEHCYPLTDPAVWPKYLSGEAYCYMNTFTEEWLRHFSENWEFEGRMTPERFVENIRQVLSRIAPQAVVCIILGSEIPYEKNTQPAYNDRQLDYKAYNDALRQLAAENPRVRLIDVNEWVHDQSDFSDNINHFQRRIYYQMAERANELIAECAHIRVERKGRLYLWREATAAWFRESNIRNTWLYSLARIPYRIMQMIKK